MQIRIYTTFFVVLTQPSFGAAIHLGDDNSTASFDTANPPNHFNWTVDGINQLNTQSFWYRIGNAPEQSLHTLPIFGAEIATNTNFDLRPDTLVVRYLGAGFTSTHGTSWMGSAPGSAR
jgi:hypothetical protein